LPIAENVLNRQFNPTVADLAYISDITYIRTGSGWLYLATVLDLYARKVVGWAIAPSMPAKLVCGALNMAIQQRQPAPGLIVHSDRGSQYASDLNQDLLTEHGFVCSMSARETAGQRRRREILPEPQNGTRVAASICQPC
jgi:putative transposase